MAKSARTAIVECVVNPDETQDEALARMLVGPEVRSGFLAYVLAGQLFEAQRPEQEALLREIRKVTTQTANGDMHVASRILTSQALSLDALFTDMTHSALKNRGEYPDAHQRYMNLALRAQANCRATLEALAKLHQPREQVVRHVHVHDGGQAVVAEEFHHHAGGLRNAATAGQAHDQGASVAALLGTDTLGNGMPVPGGEGKEKVPAARRRQGKRSASGKHECLETRRSIGRDGSDPKADEAD